MNKSLDQKNLHPENASVSSCLAILGNQNDSFPTLFLAGPPRIGNYHAHPSGTPSISYESQAKFTHAFLKLCSYLAV